MVDKNFKVKNGIEVANNLVLGSGTQNVAIDASAKVDAIGVPKGTTGQRPTTPATGQIRFNTTTSAMEVYIGTSWVNFNTPAVDLAVVDGGTGSSSAAGARTNLGLVIGTDVQEELDGAAITAVTVSATDKILLQDVSDVNRLKTVTAQSIANLAATGGTLKVVNNLSDVANAATSRTNLVLGNVNNTSDAAKPVSTATQTALNLKQNTLGYTPLNAAGGTMTGIYTMDASATLDVQNNSTADISASAEFGVVQIYQPTVGNDAMIKFHVAGDFACYFGLDGGINDLIVGGWSYGAGITHRIWHAGNDGAGSGLDADLLDGHQPDTLGSASTIVQRDAGSAIHCQDIVCAGTAAIVIGQWTRNTDTVFYSSVDNYIRKNTAAGFKASLGITSSTPTTTFTSSGTWTNPGTGIVIVIAIGGGGGGGYYQGGGGGGGGSSIGLFDASKLPGTVSVTVGAGGAAGVTWGVAGTGGTSVFANVQASGGAGGTAQWGNGGAGGASSSTSNILPSQNTGGGAGGKGASSGSGAVGSASTNGGGGGAGGGGSGAGGVSTYAGNGGNTNTAGVAPGGGGGGAINISGTGAPGARGAVIVAVI